MCSIIAGWGGRGKYVYGYDGASARYFIKKSEEYLFTNEMGALKKTFYAI